MECPPLRGHIRGDAKERVSKREGTQWLWQLRIRFPGQRPMPPDQETINSHPWVHLN